MFKRCSQHVQTNPVALWCSVLVRRRTFPQIPLEHLATLDLLLKVDQEDLPVVCLVRQGHTCFLNRFKHNLDKESEVEEVLPFVSCVFISGFCNRFRELC